MLTKGLVSNALAKSSLTCPKPGERVPRRARERQAQACPTSWNAPQNTWRSRGLQGGSRVPSTNCVIGAQLKPILYCRVMGRHLPGFC